MGDDMREFDKKLITISIPCYNEEDNVIELVDAIETQFKLHLREYDYIIQFSDNCSSDNTRSILRKLCDENKHVRAIFNVSNVPGSAIHSILQADGDCCIHMACDFQDNPSLIPEFVHEWENGYNVVCAIKHSSEENKGMWYVRKLYYKIIDEFSEINQIENFTGFGLYDRQFVEIIRKIDDPLITLRGLVAEYGKNVKMVYYKQAKRKHGKSKKNFIKNYDYAMRSFTTYSKKGIHIITISGAVLCGLSILALIISLVLFFAAHINFLVLIIIECVLFLYSSLVTMIGIVGSYVLSINIRALNRPLAIEDERIGIWENEQRPENYSPYDAFSVDKNI